MISDRFKNLSDLIVDITTSYSPLNSENAHIWPGHQYNSFSFDQIYIHVSLYSIVAAGLTAYPFVMG